MNDKLKDEINKDRAKEIVDTFSDPERYKRLVVAHWFPLERSINPFETEEEYVERRFKDALKLMGQGEVNETPDAD